MPPASTSTGTHALRIAFDNDPTTAMVHRAILLHLK